MKYKLIAIVLSCSLLFPPVIFADTPIPEPEIYSISKGEPAPFAGTLFNPTATAEVLEGKRLCSDECQLRLDFAVKKEQKKYQMLLDTLQAGYDGLEKKYNTITQIKDKEIDRLTKTAFGQVKPDYSHWWFAGGVVMGIGLTIAIVYAVKNIE